MQPTTRFLLLVAAASALLLAGCGGDDDDGGDGGGGGGGYATPTDLHLQTSDSPVAPPDDGWARSGASPTTLF
jgi:hypothetical protein